MYISCHFRGICHCQPLEWHDFNMVYINCGEVILLKQGRFLDCYDFVKTFHHGIHHGLGNKIFWRSSNHFLIFFIGLIILRYPPGNDHISPQNRHVWVDDFPFSSLLKYTNAFPGGYLSKSCLHHPSIKRARLWFQICCMFTLTWGNDPIDIFWNGLKSWEPKVPPPRPTPPRNKALIRPY